MLLLNGMKSLRLEEMNREELQNYLRETVKPDEGRIPSYIFSNPSVYQLELEKIFLKTWLFVAHESELEKPGDFVTRDMGEQSVLATKAQDGEIRVLLNVCTHRGMKLCRADKGNQSQFTCPYHGFNFRNNGELTGVPYQKDVYGDVLDRSKMGLLEARTESYGGMIYATWNKQAEPLDAFLGDMKWYLDLLVNRAEMEVMGPPQRWVVNTTWKLGTDNTISDSYHTLVTHASIAKLGLVPSGDYSKYGYQINAGNGHGLNLGMPSPNFIFPPELLPEYESKLNRDQFTVLQKTKNIIASVFPNIMLLVSSMDFKGKTIANTTVRLWQPKGPDKIEIVSWLLVERNAPREWKELSRQVSTLTFSPSGIFEQDDTENFTDITSNSKGLLHLQENITYNYQMGMHRQPVEFVGPGIAYENKFSEANARAFYKKWLEMLLADQ